MHISINGEQFFAGDIDKGCGNQVFDYGKNIEVPPDNDRTRTPAMDKVSLYGSIETERANTKAESLDPSHRRSHSKEEVRRSRLRSNNASRKSTSLEKIPTQDSSKKTRGFFFPIIFPVSELFTI